MVNILPDSRARDPKRLLPSRLGYWVPLACASCGADGGVVPEQNTTFAFWLCTPCSETYGEIAGTLSIPDEVFWQRVRDEQTEAFGRQLTPGELAIVAQEDTSPLATLIREGAANKEGKG